MPDELSRSAGERMRALRTSRRMSLAQVAAACGYATSRISEFERGGAVINMDHLGKIASALAVTPRDLLPGSGLPELGPKLDEASLRLVDAAQRRDRRALMLACADLVDSWARE